MDQTTFEPETNDPSKADARSALRELVDAIPIVIFARAVLSALKRPEKARALREVSQAH